MITTSVDYAKTAEMRLATCVTKIQECTAMASFMDDYKDKLVEWQNYYIAAKPLSDAGKFEELFNIPLPDQSGE